MTEIAELLADTIMRKIGQAGDLYYRLVILAAPAGSGKTAALRDVHERTEAPLININLELSLRMLDLAGRQRAVQTPALLREIADASAADLMLLDNIEILFAVSLRQDPLRLLQGLSRNRTAVAAWNGFIDGRELVYAAPDHPEYRRYPVRDFLIATPGAVE